jgi:hypothetical protein
MAVAREAEIERKAAEVRAILDDPVERNRKPEPQEILIYR